MKTLLRTMLSADRRSSLAELMICLAWSTCLSTTSNGWIFPSWGLPRRLVKTMLGWMWNSVSHNAANWSVSDFDSVESRPETIRLDSWRFLSDLVQVTVLTLNPLNFHCLTVHEGMLSIECFVNIRKTSAMCCVCGWGILPCIGAETGFSSSLYCNNWYQMQLLT